MISVSGVSLSFGAFSLFKDITFMINQKDRIGLVGRNGAGKSTLLKMIAGIQQYDSGQIAIPSGLTIGYLPQQMAAARDKTVIDEATSAFEEVQMLEKKLTEISQQMTERQDHHTAEYLDLIHQFTEASERFEMIGGSNIHADIEKTLLGLGFLTTDLNRMTNEFSGGWRMRIELAKLLLRRPDVLLLDEPTNHLDIESIEWLEEYLESYQGAVVLISHDKAFLDHVTKRTIEISLGKINDYKVHYSQYLILRQERREQILASYRNQQKMIEDTEEFIERFRSKATKAIQVQSRIKHLDRIERIEVDPEDISTINIRFPTPIKSGKLVLEIKELSKSYGQKNILDKIDLIVESGQKIAFVGKNGEGKSTLSKIIVNETSHDGHLKIGHNVKIGYFAQNQDELMDENISILETIDKVAVGDIRTKIRDILGAFLFRGDEVDKKVKVLSGGERSRLAMAKLLLEPYNLLILDEPTNHLDIRSKDILKKALLNYEGTLILVSHDRDFLNGLIDRLYEFKNQKIREHIGGIYEFLEKKKLNTLNELNKAQVILNANQPKKEVTENKINYLEKKEWDKTLRKVANKIKETEEKIEIIEKQISEMDKLMSNPEMMKLQKFPDMVFKKYDNLKEQLNNEMNNWQQYHEEYEKLQNSNK